VASFLLGFLGGFIAWLATEILARPLSKFFSLRAAVAEALTRYEDRYNSNRDSSPASRDWMVERKLAYEDCGADLAAFTASNAFVARLLGRSPVKRFRYYARFAASNLQSLAQTDPGTETSEYFRVRVVAALRLASWRKN
jgi:hypothetical protein